MNDKTGKFARSIERKIGRTEFAAFTQKAKLRDAGLLKESGFVTTHALIKG